MHYHARSIIGSIGPGKMKSSTPPCFWSRVPSHLSLATANRARRKTTQLSEIFKLNVML